MEKPFPYIALYSGSPILGYTHPVLYTTYTISSTVAFLTSATSILLVLCGFVNNPSRSHISVLAALTSISVGCIIFGYLAIFIAVTPDFYRIDPITYSVVVFGGLWGLGLVGVIGLKILKFVHNKKKAQRRGFYGGSRRTSLTTSTTARFGVFVMAIVAFFVIFFFTIYPSFYEELSYFS